MKQMQVNKSRPIHYYQTNVNDFFMLEEKELSSELIKDKIVIFGYFERDDESNYWLPLENGSKLKTHSA